MALIFFFIFRKKKIEYDEPVKCGTKKSNEF
jgi:hypothetical protein